MADETRLTIEIETILRGLEKTLAGLNRIERQLRNVASIKIGAAASTTAVDKAVLAAQKLQQQQQKLTVQAQELANRQERARQATDRLAASQRRLADATAKANARASATSGKQADDHIKAFKFAEARAKAEARAAAARERAAKRAADAEAREARRAAEEVRRINRETTRQAEQQARIRERAARSLANVQARETRRGANDFIRSLTQQERFLDRATRGLNAFGGALLRVGGGLRSLGATAAILLTGPLVALGTIVSRSAADIDAIRNRLIATEGSVEAANERLRELRKLADESVGVTRRAAQDTFATLSVVGGLTEETIERQIKAMGRLNAAFTIDDQQQFFRNLIQIFSQGFERADIKEALGRIPIFNQLLVSAFGTSDPARLRELKAAGKLTLDTFLAGLATAIESDQTLANIGESIRVRFAKTFERLTDALEPLGRAILGPLERIITAVEPIILRLAAAFERLPQSMQTASVVIGLLAAAIGPILFIVGGLLSGIGALATALAALAPVIGTIGLPALAVILGGILIVIGELTAIVGGLALAWKTNFLNIRGTVTTVVNEIVAAFGRIRAIVRDATERILPTLQSISEKVLRAVTAFWETFGDDLTRIVVPAFRILIDVIETFLVQFLNFVDLVAKLIDTDFEGAWRAFARILVTAGQFFQRFTTRLNQIVGRAFVALVALIAAFATAVGRAAAQIGLRFINALAAEIRAGAPTIRDAIFDMLATAVASVNAGSLAAELVRRFIAALQRAAAESALGRATGTSPFEGVTKGAGEGRPRDAGENAGTDTKGASALRRALNELQEAKDEFDAQQQESRIALLRAGTQQTFDLLKDSLEREQSALEDSFEERLVAIQAYFKERQRLQEAEIDAELAREKGLNKALSLEWEARDKEILASFDRRIQEIERDPKLRGRAGEVEREVAELKKRTDLERSFNQFQTENAEISTRILILEKQRADVAVLLGRLQRDLAREIERQREDLETTLLEERGQVVEAAAGRLRRQFRDTLRDLRVDVQSLSPELQDALNRVDLRSLQSRLDQLPEPVRLMVGLLNIGIERARIAELGINIDRTLAELRLQEVEIQNKVLDGVLKERDARASIVTLQQVAKARLLDILAAQLAIAEATEGQEDQALRIRAQIQEVERLGIAIDEVAVQLNRDLFGNLESGLSNIFSSAREGIEGVKDAVINLGFSILDTLNRVAAEGLVEQIFGDLLKPGAENAQGTIGGFFSKLFGSQPKTASVDEAAALVGAGATAATALTTGGTTAGAAMATGGATAAATLGASVTAAAAAFAAAVAAAGAAFAAAVSASGFSSSLSGYAGEFAEGDILQPKMGGRLIRVAEGGHAEAVLTTDPKHAVRQMRILREYLHQTRGLWGRIQGFAEGGIITPREAESNLLSSISRMPLFNSHVGDLAVAGGGGRNLRFLFVDDQRDVRNWMNSSEGEKVIVEKLLRNRPLIRRLAK